MLTKFKVHGLVADLMPNINLMKAFGYFLFNYYQGMHFVIFRKVYSCFHFILIFLQFALILVNMALTSGDVDELTANTITVLFFAHSIIKYIYFGIMSKSFYRTLSTWNQTNSHPLFAESDARFHSTAVTKMRRLLYAVMIGTIISVIAWITITFFGESTRRMKLPDVNETVIEEVPRLPIKAFYPFFNFSGPMYILCFAYQVYWLIFTLIQANLFDLMFCSWLIYACEQLLHLKSIMKPLMELSASLDTYRPNTGDLFRTGSGDSQTKLVEAEEPLTVDLRTIYSNKHDFGMNFRTGSTLQTFGTNGVNGANPNGLTKKQEMLVRSAIKYWVERHKHVVRFVSAVGDTYGTALLFHMLVATLTLTLLAYQATKIDGVSVYTLTVLGYLFYSLAQVFLFCIFGNSLIEESSSVMEAAYSCHWYDGSEEAKIFVQIVCQQCQKSMSISGAKFFTVSLDLFASVLGAVVTYFMVLVQLN
ncbi:odorant receptor co-receptor isoform X2 [Arctopsyche grandis]|uniref:odorant receptor co-receptor isoform X2 n=1 Tax=Arctopsyche grandis TaxID=121162 RepID=UPI00406D7A95